MAQTVLTDQGFDRPSLSELMQRIGDRISSDVYPANRRADSFIGQLIAIVSDELSVSYEAAEELFNARFLSRATGTSLDAIGQWMGLPRRGRSKTTSPVRLYGVNGTVVPAGSLVAYGAFNLALDSQVTITTGAAADASYAVDDNPPDNVALRVATLPFSVPSVGKTKAEIAAALAAAINASASADTVGFKASSSAEVLRVEATNVLSALSIIAVSGLTLTRLASPGTVTAVDYGSTSIPAGSLNSVVTTLEGWTGVSNPVDATPGSERESDSSYRARLQASSGAADGLATPEAIKELVRAVPGVNTASIIENKTMQVVDGRPPKSFNVVVSGGDRQDVGQAIWTAGGAGIETFGTELVTVTDSDGDTQIVRFSLMTTALYNVEVNITAKSGEESTSENLAALVDSGVRAYFATLDLGDDIIPQRIPGYIYALTSGITHMDIVIKDEAGVVQTGNAIPIDASQVAGVGTVTVTGA